MNEELTALYEKYWDSVMTNVYIPNLSSIPNEPPKCSYPYLIQVTDHYINASKRVMICGQETQGWGGECGTPDKASVKKLQYIYNYVVNHDNHGGPILKPGLLINPKPGTRFSPPYWNFAWNLMNTNPDAGFVFQNVVKVGKYSQAGCDNNIYELTKQYFPVWQEELKILKPDIIIFLTGNYDWRIRQVVGEFQFTPVDGDTFLDELHFENKAIPRAFRTNHPAYLQRKHRFFSVANILSRIINTL